MITRLKGGGGWLQKGLRNICIAPKGVSFLCFLFLWYKSESIQNCANWHHCPRGSRKFVINKAGVILKNKGVMQILTHLKLIAYAGPKTNIFGRIAIKTNLDEKQIESRIFLVKLLRPTFKKIMFYCFRSIYCIFVCLQGSNLLTGNKYLGTLRH